MINRIIAFVDNFYSFIGVNVLTRSSRSDPNWTQYGIDLIIFIPKFRFFDQNFRIFLENLLLGVKFPKFYFYTIFHVLFPSFKISLKTSENNSLVVFSSLT